MSRDTDGYCWGRECRQSLLREVRKDVVELAKTVGHKQAPAIYN